MYQEMLFYNIQWEENTFSHVKASIAKGNWITHLKNIS